MSDLINPREKSLMLKTNIIMEETPEEALNETSIHEEIDDISKTIKNELILDEIPNLHDENLFKSANPIKNVIPEEIPQDKIIPDLSKIYIKPSDIPLTPVIKKKKQKRRPLSKAHKEALAKGRLKALENRRKRAQQKRKAKEDKMKKEEDDRKSLYQNKLEESKRINRNLGFNNVKDFFSLMEKYEKYKKAKNPIKVNEKPKYVKNNNHIKYQPKIDNIDPYAHYFN